MDHTATQGTSIDNKEEFLGKVKDVLLSRTSGNIQSLRESIKDISEELWTLFAKITAFNSDSTLVGREGLNKEERLHRIQHMTVQAIEEAFNQLPERNKYYWIDHIKQTYRPPQIRPGFYYTDQE